MTKKGLTLIELLGVIIVLGIIAAISFPAITGVINNSRKDAVMSNANAMIEAAETFANDEILRNVDFSKLTPVADQLVKNTANTSIKVNVAYLKNLGHLENKFAGDGYVVLEIENNEITVKGVVYGEGKFNVSQLVATFDGKLVRKDVQEIALPTGEEKPTAFPTV